MYIYTCCIDKFVLNLKLTNPFCLKASNNEGSGHLSFSVKTCNFIKKETLAEVFFCEFCEMIKNTFFHRTPLVAASLNFSLPHCYQAEFQKLFDKIDIESSFKSN